jgi:hypothetical protein
MKLEDPVRCQWCHEEDTARIDTNGEIKKYVCNKCFKTFRRRSEGYVNHRGELL